MARTTLRRMMVAVAVLAACFAWLSPSLATVAALPVLYVAFGPRTYRWRSLEIAGAATWLVWAVWACSEIEPDLFEGMLLAASGLALAISWFFRLCIQGASLRSRGGWAACLVTPAAGLLGLTLLETDWDFRLRLALSEQALRASARDCLACKGVPRGPVRVGLFEARRVDEDGGRVFWYTKGGFMDMVGLAYVPAGKTPQRGGFSFWHIRGPWWRFVERF